ncbi:lpxtg-domain-containing protein [Colletotrichum asianum]|uniref:Lpxtg-domain-containing protein n=1 Tax=Colletotrichum asianum TaxID=702518 RepID=A0A8H3ZI51_9PEZI|nr:lpxtg-domain-containing protein [Colletotrichum asianum]
MAEPYPAETNASGEITSFIALPTVFTPPSSCSTVFRLNGFSIVAYDPGFGIDVDTRVRCAPAAVTTWWEQRRLGVYNGDGHTAMSIGPLTCPYQWSTVASYVKDEVSTLAMCCPPDYTLTNTNGHAGSLVGDCRSNVLTGAVLTFASSNVSEGRWRMNSTTVEWESFIGAIAVVGWNTLPGATGAPSSLSATATTNLSPPAETNTDASALPRQTTPTEPTPTILPSTPTEIPTSINQGIPLSTTIGIGVGVGVGVIAIFLVAFLLWRRRRRQLRSSEEPPAFDARAPIPYEPDKYAYQSYYHELYGHQDGRPAGMAEMPVPQYVAELDARYPRVI